MSAKTSSIVVPYKDIKVKVHSSEKDMKVSSDKLYYGQPLSSYRFWSGSWPTPKHHIDDFKRFLRKHKAELALDGSSCPHGLFLELCENLPGKKRH
jgi:hypothetical protein